MSAEGGETLLSPEQMAEAIEVLLRSADRHHLLLTRDLLRIALRALVSEAAPPPASGRMSSP